MIEKPIYRGHRWRYFQSKWPIKSCQNVSKDRRGLITHVGPIHLGCMTCSYDSKDEKNCVLKNTPPATFSTLRYSMFTQNGLIQVLSVKLLTQWRHQMETFSVLLALCVGNSPVTGEFPTQKPVTRSFDVFFHLRLNKQLSKQSWGWFETPSRSLWRHCNDHEWIQSIWIQSTHTHICVRHQLQL